MHTTIRTIAGLVVTGTALLGLSSSAPAASGFDGDWSVLITTESGSCDPAYRYPVRIQNGAVIYHGDAAVSVSGSVASNGAVRVSIARGSHRADGIGRLNATAGIGTWTGVSSTSQCHGRWQAERPAK